MIKDRGRLVAPSVNSGPSYQDEPLSRAGALTLQGLDADLHAPRPEMIEWNRRAK